LLLKGVFGFCGGEGGVGRGLVLAEIEGGARADEALALLERLNRLNLSPSPEMLAKARSVGREPPVPAPPPPTVWSRPFVALMFVLALVSAILYSAIAWGPLDWAAPLSQRAGVRASGTASPDAGPMLPRRGELALTRARALAASGHLRDALVALESVRPTDPQKAEADQLRGDIQLQLLALTSVPAQPAPERVVGTTERALER
jgi:hypothetical protein